MEPRLKISEMQYARELCERVTVIQAQCDKRLDRMIFLCCRLAADLWISRTAFSLSRSLHRAKPTH